MFSAAGLCDCTSADASLLLRNARLFYAHHGDAQKKENVESRERGGPNEVLHEEKIHAEFH